MDSAAAFQQAQWERRCQLSAAIVVAFEYLMHVPSEVDLFWRQRWTLAKCLFLWSRYYSLVYNIANAAVFLQPNASDDVHKILSLGKLRGYSPIYDDSNHFMPSPIRNVREEQKDPRIFSCVSGLRVGRAGFLF
ncbi:hypothetical protein B0H15DRAFT_86958 [Mycena belliarum]|uniref:DUF6533 domain-containing protein n=1 Tax=Mycena belliarum TaxID=1033014 RepID=A0AAD6XLG0_9AGAR|nr:hypothetical protein B0H15DRAFT_86958 [Mycena belliae]